jgi:tRNA-modifying protein YgfZ
MSSPLLALPGAVAGNGVDGPVAAHYGSLYGEQVTLEAGDGFVDLSHHDVFRVSGPDRLQWLHDLTTQYFLDLAPRAWTQALVLSPQGHVEHAFAGIDDGESFTAATEPGQAAPLVEFLDRMRFMSRVEVAEVTPELALTYRPAVGHELVPRDRLTAYAEAAGPACGLWAYEALRIARGEPRLGLDTDHRTIPNEVGWLGTAVHLDKGCYRGQETVARVHNLGHPPRRLVFLSLDGSEDRLPGHGDPVELDGATIGFTGSAARHYELGPIALALVKRTVPVDATLLAGGVPAAQEIIVPPDAGANVKLTLRRRQLM